MRKLENCYASVDVRRRLDRGSSPLVSATWGGKLASCWRLSLRKKRFRRLHSVTAKAIKGKVAALMTEPSQNSLFLQSLDCSHISHVKKTLTFVCKTCQFDKFNLIKLLFPNQILAVGPEARPPAPQRRARAGIRAGSGHPPAPAAQPALANSPGLALLTLCPGTRANTRVTSITFSCPASHGSHGLL